MQTAKSIDAWRPIANFLTTEPRCVNCHGRVNPFIKGTGLDAGDDPNDPTPASKVLHGGGLIVRQRETAPDGTRLMEGECMECHDSMVPKPDGSKSRWTLAPNFLSFVDKDATTLCRQIKRSTGSAEHFLGHLENDNGGNTFALTAFKGDRGLDPDRFEEIQPDPPSVSHDELMQHARNWVNAMGGSFKGDESCGCEFKHARWSGQIHYTFDSTGGSHDEQADTSFRRFSQITLTFKDGVGTFEGLSESSSQTESRRWIVDNGARSLIKDDSSETQGSGGRTVPATVEVELDATGEYSIQASWSPQPLGTSHTVSCHYTRDGAASCRSYDLPLYAETWLGGRGPDGKISDRNHVTGSKTERHDEMVGNSKNGQTIRTLTWDLWRSN